MTLNHRIWRILPVLAVLLAGPPVAAHAAAPDADEIMRAHFALPEAQDMSATMYMVLRAADGTKLTRTLRIDARQTPRGTDQYTEFLSPADVRGTRFLTLARRNGADEQRLWLPDLGKVRLIAAAGKGGKFMGSDFSYYDMESRDFGDAAYRLDGEDTCTYTLDGRRAEHACWVIASTPTDPDAPYSLVKTWVSRDEPIMVRSEMFDRNGQPVKSVYVTEWKSFGQVLIPLKTLAAAADGHKTLLQMEDVRVNQGVPAATFTLQNLQR